MKNFPDLFKLKLTKLNISWPIFISSGALIVSVISAVHSINAFNQTLPLSSANLIFSEESVEVTYGGQDTATTSDDKVFYTPKLYNKGLSTASDVKFQLYVMYSNQKLSFRDSKTKLFKYFNDKLLVPLQPNSYATFGTLSMNRIYSDENPIDLFTAKEKLILVFYLEYTDDLSGELQKKCYVYNSQFLSKNISTLITREAESLYNAIEQYNKINNEKICDGLISEKFN